MQKYQYSIIWFIIYIISLLLSMIGLEYFNGNKTSTFLALFFWAGFPFHLFLIFVQASYDSMGYKGLYFMHKR